MLLKFKKVEIDQYKISYFYIRVAPDKRKEGYSFFNNNVQQNTSMVEADHQPLINEK